MSTSPKSQDAVFPSESDKRQKLIDKIHSTNNTINVFKKEVEELKKKCKKANDTSKPKKAKSYGDEITAKEDIIGTLCLALSWHGEELKALLVGDGNAVNYNDSDESSVELEENKLML